VGVLLLLLVLRTAPLARCGEEAVTPYLKNAPLAVVALLYSDWSGQSVEVVQGVQARITIPSGAEISRGRACELVEEALRAQNLGFFPIASNRVVLTWIDPAKRRLTPSPPASYRERLQHRRQESRRK
jgi:hypothetical protein